MNAKAQKAESHASGSALETLTGTNDDRGDRHDGFVKLDKGFAVLSNEVFGQGEKIAVLESSIAKQGETLSSVDKRVALVEKGLADHGENHGKKISSLETYVHAQGEKTANLVTGVAVLTGQVTALDSKVDFKFENADSKIDNLESKMDSGFKNVDSKFENVDSKIDNLESKMDSGFKNVDSKIDTDCVSKEDFSEFKIWMILRVLVPVCVICSALGGGIAAIVQLVFF